MRFVIDRLFHGFTIFRWTWLLGGRRIVLEQFCNWPSWCSLFRLSGLGFRIERFSVRLPPRAKRVAFFRRVIHVQSQTADVNCRGLTSSHAAPHCPPPYQPRPHHPGPYPKSVL